MLFPLDTVREVAHILQNQGLGEITLETAQGRLTLKRPPIAAPAALLTPGEQVVADELEAAVASETEAALPAVLTVVSPAVGVYRVGKKPLQVGDEVAKKASLGAVETLNIPTELIAPQAARITEILVIDGQGVEWGQPLLTLEPLESTA